MLPPPVPPAGSPIGLESLKAQLRAALDPVAFSEETLRFKLDPWQQQFVRSNARQVILLCSRHAGKSSSAAVLALHQAYHQPDSLVLLVAPSQRQAGLLLSKVTSFIRRLDPPPKLDSESVLSIRFDNGSKIVSLPGDNPATIRGYSSPALVLEDEAAFVNDGLYYALRPMLSVGNGRIVLMSTPQGRRGHFYEEWIAEDDDWERIKTTAEDCPRMKPEFLAKERAKGELFYRREYMCEFTSDDDQVFSSETLVAAITDQVESLRIVMKL